MPPMNEKRIFITGAAGFVGYHVANHLRDRGDIVIGYDNFNDYYSPELKQQRVAHLEGIEVVEGELCDATKLKKTFNRFAPTHVIHLAAQAGVRHSLESPHTHVDSNVIGFLNVLELCKECPDIPLIYASSSSVYGLNDEVPYAIGSATDCQASVYGFTKKCNELMAATYHHLYGIAVTGLRYFTVYGPWGRPDMAYYTFTEKISSGMPIALYNYGKMERDFTFIDDIVAGTVAALDKGAPCALYNLGNHCPVSLETFVTTLEELLGTKAKKEYLPMQKGDVVRTHADIDAAKRDLGYHPRTSLGEGLQQFVEWYRHAPLDVKG